MTESSQPTRGSLEAKIIRACTKHNNKCNLDCPRRTVEELGQIASFDARPEEKGGSSSWQAWFRQLVKQ